MIITWFGCSCQHQPFVMVFIFAYFNLRDYLVIAYSLALRISVDVHLLMHLFTLTYSKY